MGAKLCQIVAVLPSKKSAAEKTLTEAYHVLQKGDLFSGLTRTYQPKDETGEPQPAEKKLPQVRVKELIERATTFLTDVMDCVATQDTANCAARADVKVDGKVIASSVPVTHLLFLEKKLVDLTTFIGKLPVLDAAEEWEYRQDVDYWATKPAQNNRTKKTPRVIERSPATKEHPAQTELIHEDLFVGTWTLVKFSSAIPASERNAMLVRVAKLSEAVKMAREEANGMEVTSIKIGGAVLSYLFQG